MEASGGDGGGERTAAICVEKKQMKLMTASVCLAQTGRSTVSGAMLNTPHMVK